MKNTQTIQALYAAFQRGDVPAILDHLSDEVDWNNDRVASKECPWNGNFHGKSHVPAFFKAVGDSLDIKVFDPHTYIESGQHVAVLLRIGSRIKKNGKAVENDAVHVWTFNDRGQVTAYRHFNDTAMELAAWRS